MTTHETLIQYAFGRLSILLSLIIPIYLAQWRNTNYNRRKYRKEVKDTGNAYHLLINEETGNINTIFKNFTN